jgi:hypothetical protein
MYRTRWTRWLVQTALAACGLVAAAGGAFAQPESCGDGGGGANDIRSLTARFEPLTQEIVVTLRLCAEPDAQSKYRLRFDSGPGLVEYPKNSGTLVTATIADGNPLCLTTDDTGLMLHKGRAHGPGAIVVSGDLITFTMPVGALSPEPDNLVRYRADVQSRGVTDMAPNVNAADGCSKPQTTAELQTLYTRGIGDVVGTQAFDIVRAPTRLFESAMGNLVADAMRTAGAGIDAALTNSGGLRQDLRCVPPSSGEQPCEITFGEAASVLPFGNLTVLVTLTGAQVEAALLNGVSPACNPAIATGRFPQVSGIGFTFACNGSTPVIVDIWRTPSGSGGPHVPLGGLDTIRVVTNDFMLAGGDGYTVLASGTDVASLEAELLGLLVDYLGAYSPVAPVVEGRIQRAW